MWTEVAIGTLVGIVSSAVIIMATIVLYERWRDPRTKAHTSQLLMGIALIAVFSVGALFAWPYVASSIEEQQRIAQSMKVYRGDIKHCNENKARVMLDAAEAVREPRGLIPYARATRDGYYLGSYWQKTPYGWLRTCRSHGIISMEEFEGVQERQRQNQQIYDEPELAKERERKKQIEFLFRPEHQIK